MVGKKLNWAVPLLLITPLLAVADAEVPFRHAVVQNFMRATFAGAWETGCIVDDTGAMATKARYVFSAEATASLSRSRYADTACAVVVASEVVDGVISLDGLSIDQYGRYVYEISVTPTTGDAVHRSLHFDPRGELTVIENLSPLKQLAMQRAR